MLVRATEALLVKAGGKTFIIKENAPIELPIEVGTKLAERMPDKVQIIQPCCSSDRKTDLRFTYEPALPRLVYWQTLGGIIGPGQAEYLARVDNSYGKASFWICVSYRGLPRWIHESIIRSRAQFARQPTAPPDGFGFRKPP